MDDDEELERLLREFGIEPTPDDGEEDDAFLSGEKRDDDMGEWVWSGRFLTGNIGDG